MTTLASIIIVLAATFLCVWMFEHARQELKRSRRDCVRRLQRYLDQLPPARPW